MREKSDISERRTFWPRPGRPDVQAAFDFDRPCGNCGYNLRGLPMGTPCPECGSVRGLTLADDPLPFEMRRSLIALLQMMFYVIFNPHELARHVWAPIQIELDPARTLRRWCLVVATPSLCVIAFWMTAQKFGTSTALWCLPFHAAAVVVCLNAATLEPVSFFRDKASGVLLKRVQTLAHYASAPLLLVPAHLALLPFTGQIINNGDFGWVIATSIHVALLLATLALGLLFVAWLFHETVDISAAGAFAFTIAAATTTIASAAVLLVCVPAMVASLVWNILK